MKKMLFWGGNVLFWTILFVVFIELGYSKYKLLKTKSYYKDNFLVISIDYVRESTDQEKSGRNYLILGKIQSTSKIQKVDFKNMTTFCDTLTLPEERDTIPIWSIKNFKNAPVIPRVEKDYPNTILKKLTLQSFFLATLTFFGICFSIFKICKR